MTSRTKFNKFELPFNRIIDYDLGLYDQEFRIVVRKFLEASYEQDHAEYRSSQLAQAAEQATFSMREGYFVSCEQPPDDTRRRMDIKIERMDPDQHTMITTRVGEVKRGKGSVRVVEDQALDAAKKTIRHEGLLGTYAVTIVGVYFRGWLVDRLRKKLEPLCGPDDTADKSNYSPIIVWDWVLGRFRWHDVWVSEADLIKSEFPRLQAPPTLPSQALDQNAMSIQYPQSSTVPSPGGGYTYGLPDEMDMGDYEAGTSMAEGYANPGQQQDAMDIQDDTMVQTEAEFPEQSTGPPANRSGNRWNGKAMKEVKVKRITHLLQGDEFEFENRKGTTTRVPLRDWHEHQIDGHSVKAYETDSTFYWCRKSKFPR
ncbi:uncharacterized protein F4807DRAFT_434087 [Annulohypoxylon truncatum]|uniref:uncharacterized protein n=1 Tax=Annulohypoxylon truncatum TaxID=327061 RepID=UPI0020078BF9|nr:uncharacterized protein F4807DRAFT_434087 [Annulohypoxylon truncatum]KAI1207662.1 hypothetical protein F4807DRAFT_434087 [Annulohypoxylon truncatum]